MRLTLPIRSLLIIAFCLTVPFSCQKDDPVPEPSAEAVAMALEPEREETRENTSVELESALKVVSYGPKGSTNGQAQVRIDFNNPIIPLTTLSDDERAAILDNFQIEPAIDGAFRLLGTSSVVFEPKSYLWMSTSYTVRVSKNVSDIGGSSLEEDLEWQFQTPLPRINVYPSNDQHHIKLDAVVTLRSSVALDLASLRSKVSFYQMADNTPVPFDLLPHERNPDPNTDEGQRRRSYQYVLKPKQDMNLDTRHAVDVAAGVMPFQGNRPTDKPISARFRTYPLFTYESTGFCEHCGNHLTTQPYLAFSNAPHRDYIAENIIIDPPVENPFLGWSHCGRYSLTFDDGILEANTSYTVQLKAGLQDQYGQTLENPTTVTIQTGELTPKLWGPRGYQIVTPQLAPELGVKTVNIDRIFHAFVPLSPKDVLVREHLNGYGALKNLLNQSRTVFKPTDMNLNEAKVGKTVFDLRDFLRGDGYGAVAYSYKTGTVACRTKPLQNYGILLRTNLGIFTQFYPSTGIIKLNRLTDGEPVANAKIKIYREEDLSRLEKIHDIISKATPSHDPCFEGTTDANGLLVLSNVESKLCVERRVSNKVLNEFLPPEADPDDELYDRVRYGHTNPPRLLIVAEKGDDWTFIQTSQYGNPQIYNFGVPVDWEAQRPIATGTIFSDHFLYRPGDTVKMKGVMRFLQYGTLLNGAGKEVTIRMSGPGGDSKVIGTAKVNEFGTFHFEVPTTADQKLGYYNLRAELKAPKVTIHGNFRLAEFRVPEFKVGMEIDRQIAVVGQPFNVSWTGNYYFGAPMPDAPSSLNVTRRPAYFRPKGWESFTFGVPTHLRKKRMSVSGQYARETINLDKEGVGRKEVSLSQSDAPFPMTYRFDVEVEDVSRQKIAAERAVTVLPHNQLVGLQLDSWIVEANTPISAKVIVTSPEGEALSGVPVTVKLISKEYHSIKKETPDGRFRMEHNLVQTTVEEKSVSSGSSAQTVEITPEKAGSYYLLAELEARPNSGTSAATSIWASGSAYVPWQESGEDKLQIVMDKTEYEVGDEAVAFIQSPFPEAELYVNLGRDRSMKQEVRRIQGSGYSYKFTVTEDMIPNAFVTAALFRLGDAIVPVEEEVGKHMERIGIGGFSVSLSSKYLDVSVRPSRKKARPAENVTVDIQIDNSSKQGHRSELTVMVVDEAVLALSGYSPPDLVRSVYRRRGLSSRFTDNRPFVINKEALLQKGVGYGGGESAGLDEPRVRKDFVKLAYYDPELVTDASGKASFSFKTPDNLTTWRVMVVAVGESDLFGYGSEQLTISQPFILRPVQPRFARIGDKFYSGVAITNLTEGNGDVELTAEVTGTALGFGKSASPNAQASLEQGQSRVMYFPFEANAVGQSTLRFTARMQGIFDGSEINEADAVEIPLDIQDLLASETVVAVGETKDKATQQIKIENDVRTDVGGLDMRVSSTALTNIGEGAKYLVEYPYGCLEQSASRLLALMQLKFLAERYQFELDAYKPTDKVIQANLRKIFLMQHNDGGFRYWPSSSQSSCYMSPYVAYMFKRSQELGYDIPRDKIDKLRNYLDKVLRNPCYTLSTWRAMAEYRISILAGLNYLGKKDETYFEEYFNKRNDLSFGAQIQLAYLMHQTPRWKSNAKTMLEEIRNALFVTAQTAHLESPRDLPGSWRFMYSPVITTASAIKLWLEMEPDSPLIGKFARYILNARKNGRWRHTYENARAIDGLVETALKKESQPPDYTTNIMLAGQEVLSHMFKGYQYKPVEKTIRMTDLPSGLNTIDIAKEGSGDLYYTLSYSYRLKGPQSARQEGFTVKRTVRNRDSGEMLVSYGDDPAERLDIKPGDVLEVELEYTAKQTGYHMILDDPIPAGLEGIDASLKTTSSRHRNRPQSGNNRRARGYDDDRWSSRNPINHTELRDDRVVLYASQIRPGTYSYKYLLRATTSGVFLWPGATASLMYEPEEFGSSSEGFVKVER